MLDLIFSVFDANEIDNEKPSRRLEPVNLKFIFGFELMMEREQKKGGAGECPRQVQNDRFIYVFLR